MRRRYAAQRRECNLHRIARRTRRVAIEKAEAVLGERRALGGAEMEQRRFRGFRIVLRGLHRLPATLEMRGKLRGGDGRTGGALAFQRGTDVAVKFRTAERSRAFVQHLAEQRMSERIRRFRRRTMLIATRQP